jgi:hypothetical protein
VTTNAFFRDAVLHYNVRCDRVQGSIDWGVCAIAGRYAIDAWGTIRFDRGDLNLDSIRLLVLSTIRLLVFGCDKISDILSVIRLGLVLRTDTA